MENELHFPPGSPEAQAAADAKAKAEADAKAATEAAEKAKADEAAKAEADAKAKAEADAKAKEEKPASEAPAPIKKRSIYDDLKDKKQEVRDLKNVAVSALKAAGIETTGKETPEELQALLEKHNVPSKTKEEVTPATPAPASPTDELEAYAQEMQLDTKALTRLVEIITKHIPKAELSNEERKQLSELQTWKSGKVAEEQRAAEDNEIRSQAPSVKTELGIHDDSELKAVMEAIVKLAHTERFHDKEVGYIVWANREALAKMVSPKKPSFESGDGIAPAAAEAEPDFSARTGITPEMAARQTPRGPAHEIRRSR